MGGEEQEESGIVLCGDPSSLSFPVSARRRRPCAKTPSAWGRGRKRMSSPRAR